MHPLLGMLLRSRGWNCAYVYEIVPISELSRHMRFPDATFICIGTRRSKSGCGRRLLESIQRSALFDYCDEPTRRIVLHLSIVVHSQR